ncbi:transcriptional regulator [Motilibacter peucedani]|uniref:Transcriptional regulator n=1 Tax=Motilibacter peucedani TaxID=598650 RepID=A0A420XQV7_9ACTN|nr:BTAD domain-containing putative transcriptional regulator [Motilibacter peucedani]RKS75691.1 transcriptional regulator [Motilibacter peucedani]
MLYRLLGPLEVVHDGVAIDLGAPKQRAVLAALLLHRGRVVSTDRLVESVWGDEAPPSAVPSLQVHVSNLRRVLRDGHGGSAPVERRQPGYVLTVDDAQVDVARFTAAADAARHHVDAGEWDDACQRASEALELWRGPLLADLADEDWVRVEAVGLEQRRTECLETLATALLGRGRVAEALARTSVLVAEQPYRERARWLHLVALHRDGRTAEALEDYRAHAHRLAEELGMEPGGELRELQAGLLRDDPALRAWPAVPGAAARVPEQVEAPRRRASDEEPAARVPAARRPAEGPGALVGRARESAVLDSMAQELAAGRPSWLVLTGPPGIGKTRLAEEAVARFRSVGAREAWGRCPEEEGVPAWWPLRQVVRALGADPDSVLVPPRDVDADTARFAVYERVLQLLEAATAEGPVALVVDDVQWSDATSLRALAYLSSALRDRPLAVVLTLRDGEGSSDVAHLLAALARREAASQLAVPPLAADEVVALASEVAGETVAPADARLLAERTGGNPLFVAEYARLPRDERSSGGIPLAVRTVLGRRLARLPEPVQVLLRAAAVLGDPFPVDLLAETARLSFDEVADLLEAAADEHIISAARGSSGYAFSHALLREEVLAGLPALRRQRLHARVAEVTTGIDSDSLARRALHLVAAQPLVEPGVVVQACTAAAEDAEARWDADTAAQWWESALGALDRLPPAARGTERRDDLVVARLQALARAGRDQTVLDVVDDELVSAAREVRTGTIGRLAAVLLRTSGAWPWASYGDDPGVLLARLESLTGAVATDPAAHVRVLGARAVGSCYAPDLAVPDALSREALERAEALGDPDVLADALVARVLAFVGAAAHARESIELLDRVAGLHHEQARVDEVLRHNVLTMSETILGRVEVAEEHLRDGVAGADLLRLPVTRVQLRWAGAMLAQWRGRLDEAEQLVTRAWALHRQTELYESGVHNLALLSVRWDRGRVAELPEVVAHSPEPGVWAATAAAETGDLAGARELLDDLVPVATPFYWYSLGHQVLLAHVAADCGALEHAATLVERLTPHSGHVAAIGQVGVIGTVDAALGRLHAVLGDHGTAARLLRDSVELSRRAGGVPSELRSRLALALLGPPGDARDEELAAVAAAADALGMHGVRDAARAALG